MTSTSDKRLDAARRLAAHVGEHLQADLSVRLWNGETVPLGPRSTDGVRLAINTPQAMTRLARRPWLTTIIELLAAGDLAIENGTLLDVAARRADPEGPARGLPRGASSAIVAFRPLVDD